MRHTSSDGNLKRTTRPSGQTQQLSSCQTIQSIDGIAIGHEVTIGRLGKEGAGTSTGGCRRRGSNFGDGSNLLRGDERQGNTRCAENRQSRNGRRELHLEFSSEWLRQRMGPLLCLAGLMAIGYQYRPPLVWWLHAASDLASTSVDKNSQVYPQGKLYPRKEKEEKEGKRRKRERNDKSISARRVYM